MTDSNRSRILVLVKHSLPEMDFSKPACLWQISSEGHMRCTALAEHLRRYDPSIIYSSTEPKAIQTAQAIAQQVPCSTMIWPNLHEHERPLPVVEDKKVFESSVAAFFHNPAKLCFGTETADQAFLRFSQAIESLMQQEGENCSTCILVTHGTVISLYVSRLTGAAPFPIWQHLGLPSLIALIVPDHRILEFVETFAN